MWHEKNNNNKKEYVGRNIRTILYDETIKRPPKSH
jgi:hypothetical protein